MDIRIAKTKKGIINAFLELRSKKAIEKLSIYGGFYAFENCRSFGEDSVIDVLSEINQKIMELLQ